MISYEKDIDTKKLVTLFQSVQWIESASEPERLHNAILNSDYVVTYWEDDNLVGLISTITDGWHTFIVYLLVHPLKENKGIGTLLLKEVEKHYKNYRLILTTDIPKYYRRLDYIDYGVGMFKEA